MQLLVKEVDSPNRAKRMCLAELEARCQKLRHREVGSWMARHVSRPLALRVTWLIAPWGISAHVATLTAWGMGMAAALAFCGGNRWAWLLGASLWQLAYLFDHVDGQLARLRRTESLDGVQLDYWMHHSVHLAIPCGLGYGLFARSGNPWWLFAGMLWGMALLIVGVEPDTRAKSFLLRLKRLRGELRVVGGGGGRPAPAPSPERSLFGVARWTLRKAMESHVLMNGVALLAFVQVVLGDREMRCGQAGVALMSMISAVVAALVIGRSVGRHKAEQEFAAWFRLPPDSELVFHDGWWVVDRREDSGSAQLGQNTCPAERRSS